MTLKFMGVEQAAMGWVKVVVKWVSCVSIPLLGASAHAACLSGRADICSGKSVLFSNQKNEMRVAQVVKIKNEKQIQIQYRIGKQIVVTTTSSKNLSGQVKCLEVLCANDLVQLNRPDVSGAAKIIKLFKNRMALIELKIKDESDFESEEKVQYRIEPIKLLQRSFLSELDSKNIESEFSEE